MTYTCIQEETTTKNLIRDIIYISRTQVPCNINTRRIRNLMPYHMTFIKLIEFILNMYGYPIRFNSQHVVKRSDSWFVNSGGVKNLSCVHNLYDSSVFGEDLDTEVKDAYYTISPIYIDAMKTTVFNTILPDEQYNRQDGTTTYQAGLSLVLKQTPKHLTHVLQYESDGNYKDATFKHKHLLIYSSRPFQDYAMARDDDYSLLRNVIASIPWFLNIPDGQLKDVLLEVADNNTTPEAWLQHFAELFYTKEVVTILKQKEYTAFYKLNKITSANLNHKVEVRRNTVRSRLEAYQEALNDLQHLLEIQAGRHEDKLTDKDIAMLVDNAQVNCLYFENDSVINFKIKSVLNSYDKEAAETYIKSLRTHIPDPTEQRDTLLHILYIEFLNELLIKESCTLTFTDRIRINFENSTFTGSGVYLGNSNNENDLQNPHHKYFDCWGSYGPAIAELITTRSYLNMFLQIKAAVGSLNMTDYAVLGKFKREFIEEFDWGFRQIEQAASCIQFENYKEHCTIYDAIKKLADTNANIKQALEQYITL